MERFERFKLLQQFKPKAGQKGPGFKAREKPTTCLRVATHRQSGGVLT